MDVLKHGILGLLNYGEMTGYEIHEAFESSLKFFWPAQTSQIYRELTVLEKNKWIVKRTVEQSGKPNKKICSITEEGRRELLRWLSSPDIPAEMRSPTLMKVFFMGALPGFESLSFFKRLHKEYECGWEALQQTGLSIASYQELIPDKQNALFWKMTADFGKRYTQMYLQWIEDCIHILESMEE
ncbi:MAG: PadR family transcriptional regulator [Eubacteriales bacterium]|nr:PadR family transcriptional regulator [Eubacteriales bacterium]